MMAVRCCWVIALVVSVAVSAFAADESRTWTDATGKYKIQGAFVELKDGKVTLKKADGKEMTIDLKKLSEADQKHVQGLMSPPKDPDDPFQEKTPTTPAFDGLLADKTLNFKYEGVPVLPMAPSAADWKLDVPPPPAEKLQPRVINLPPKTDFFEGLHGFVTNPAAKRGVAGYVVGRPGQKEATSRLALVDLAGGKSLGGGKREGSMVPIALHDNGQWVLMKRSEHGWGNSDRLQIWAVTANGVLPGVAWAPYDNEKGGDRDIGWAAFLSEDRLLTLSGKGKLVAWNLNPLEPIWTIPLAGGMAPALSADRQRLLFAADGQVGVLEAATGKVLALQKTPKQHFPFPVFSFSPNGKRFACTAFDRIYVWDTATGVLQKEIVFKDIHVGGAATWTDDEHVLVGNQWLFDIAREIKFWQYQGFDKLADCGGLVWLARAGDKQGAIVGTQLPGPSQLTKLKELEAQPDFYILKPGLGVKLDVTGLMDAGEKDKVTATLISKLGEVGITVDPNSAVTLAASTEPGKEEEVGYHTFGSFGTRIYTMKTFASRLKFLYNGQVAWQAQGSNVPGSINPAKDEKVQDHLKKFEKPNYRWFGQVEMPRLLVKPTGNNQATLGVSQVTDAGLR